MGYFANGTEHELYERRYCSKCIHFGTPESLGCAVMAAHMLKNYEDCNKPDSILHVLIPRKGIENLECRMFVAADKPKENFASVLYPDE